jgi:hypothetical protein
MLDRVVMNVVEVSLQILFIANRVLPEPRLPDPSPVASAAGLADGPLRPPGRQPPLGELLLDPGPTRRISIITRRQYPERVQMIGQKHRGE